MKKLLKIIGTVLAMIVLCLVGAAFGLLLSLSLFSGLFNGVEIIIGIAGILLSLYISIIIHEGGHLVFGLLSGYGFSSFRIANFMWIKQDGKIRFRRLSITGTGGQCLMTPPEEKNGKTPVVLYNLGGVIANILLSVIFGLSCFLIGELNLIGLVLFFGAIVSFVMALSNGIPMNVGGIANDGMNALHLSKDRVATAAFVNQLRMNAEQAKGIRISRMPDEWFELPEGADMQNVMCASIAVFSASRTLDRLDTEAAEREVEALLDSDYNIIGLHKNLLKCDLVFSRLINHGKQAEISSLLGMEQLKFMKSMKSYPSVLRTEYAIALIRDNDLQKAESIMADFEKMAKKYPYPSDIESDRELCALALEKYKKDI